jgi:hypothetical protein
MGALAAAILRLGFELSLRMEPELALRKWHCLPRRPNVMGSIGNLVIWYMLKEPAAGNVMAQYHPKMGN